MKGLLEKLFNKPKLPASNEPFTAQIIFECELVLQNKKRVTAALEEFATKHGERIVGQPSFTQASDGNVIQLLMLCMNADDLAMFNKDLEIIAYRYGLRNDSPFAT